MNGITMTGIIKEVRPLLSKKDNKHFANECDVESTGKGGKRTFLSLTDFDVKVKYSENQVLENFPVYAESFGKNVVYHPVNGNNGNGEIKKPEEKKPIKV